MVLGLKQSLISTGKIELRLLLTDGVSLECGNWFACSSSLVEERGLVECDWYAHRVELAPSSMYISSWRFEMSVSVSVPTSDPLWRFEQYRKYQIIHITYRFSLAQTHYWLKKRCLFWILLYHLYMCDFSFSNLPDWRANILKLLDENFSNWHVKWSQISRIWYLKLWIFSYIRRY